jgi:hypothetical protein
MLEINASGERCLCDFTFDFYWQHLGSRLDMDDTAEASASVETKLITQPTRVVTQLREFEGESLKMIKSE